MGRAVVILATPTDRLKAAKWCSTAPDCTTVTFAKPKRSADANAKMWVLLTELAEKLPWHGLKLSAEDYKDLLTAGLKRELRTVPNVDGNGFVMLGARTSDMSVAEMNELIDFIFAFASAHGVEFSARDGAALHSSNGDK